MYIIPAIDLRSGKCVRLIQGDYNRQITYKDDPAEQARDFIRAGAEWLHIVDLDGAKLGKVVNIEAISVVADWGKLRIEVGGGIRDEESIITLLEKGVERVIIGTRAVSDFNWFSQMAEKYTGKIALGLDARGSKLAAEGWTRDYPQPMIDFAKKAAKLPLAAIIYTDIERDGMLSGPNLERTRAVVEAVELPVIAAGGVNSLEDIKKLAATGVAGAIIGRALYEGTLDLVAALEAAK
jgi:phosphoribosylformimino-5-aminoimidazole carboxamide ribotide isomerase